MDESRAVFVVSACVIVVVSKLYNKRARLIHKPSQDLDRWKIIHEELENDKFNLTIINKLNEKERYRLPLVHVKSLSYPYPSFLPPVSKRYDYFRKHFKHKSGDIVISTFPKSGTTWMETIVLLLLNGGDLNKINVANTNWWKKGTPQNNGKTWPIQGFNIPDNPIPDKYSKNRDFLVLEDLKILEDNGHRRVFKCHDYFEYSLGLVDGKLPEGVKVIQVIRNACVSYYYHAYSPFNSWKNNWPFDAYVKAWASG
eukprot:UN25578